MIVECQKCGAPLSVVEGVRLVQCTYCGATSQVRSGRTVAQPQYPLPPQQPYPVPPQQQPYPVQPPPYVYRPAPPGSGKAGGAVAAIVVAGGLTALGGVVAVLALSTSGGSVFTSTINPTAQATVETIAIGAAEPLSRLIPGVAGGPVRGGSVSASCRGYFPVAPQYALRVTAMQRVRLTTVGSQDLTMAVRDTSGVYRCDDDGGQGSNPLLDLPLAPGLYPVWIGTYRQRYTAGFSLQVQTGEPGAAAFGSALSLTAPPTLGRLPLFGPTTVATRTGIAGGLVAASTLGSNCRGYIPAAPHLELDAADYRRVVLVTAASRDLTMVVRDASGAFRCDDDSGGSSQPRIETTLSPGAHQVWIGTYSANDSANFTLSVQSQSAGTTPPLAGGISPQSRPTVSVLDLDRAPTTTALRGSIVGTLRAAEVAPSCRGYLTSAPQLRLVTGTPRRVSITATSGTDLTMLARGPNGDVVCADDSPGSTNPSIEADIAAGETTIWIGSYGGSSRASFRVQVTLEPGGPTRPVK
ncbi:MAG: hypothetical protein IPF99_30640 [Deltaproteobacteria bacterium]|nr:hypothetical protein [Deltaproteobacteria bacterium]